MKRPSLQFYPADWRNNAKLRRCTHAARGVWMDVMCLLHDADEYGVLRWPLKDIAQAAGAPLQLVRELVDKDVLKGGDSGIKAFVFTPRHANQDGPPVTLVEAAEGPAWFSSRLVRDEYVRQRRGVTTRFGADQQQPQPSPKASPKPPIGERQGDGPTSPSASSTNTPISPQGGKRTSAVGLKTWIETRRAAGQKLIPDDDPIHEYAEKTGIPVEFLTLAWLEFRHRYCQPDAKKYIDWPKVFRTAVRCNYLKLWYLDAGSGQYGLTTAGKQAQRAHEERKPA
jgi:hypothetical protein